MSAMADRRKAPWTGRRIEAAWAFAAVNSPCPTVRRPYRAVSRGVSGVPAVHHQHVSDVVGRLSTSARRRPAARPPRRAAAPRPAAGPPDRAGSGRDRVSRAWPSEPRSPRRDRARPVRLEHRQADGHVLDREAGGVEQRDRLVRIAPAPAGEHLAQLGHPVARHEAGLHRAGQLAAVAGLLPTRRRTARSAPPPRPPPRPCPARRRRACSGACPGRRSAACTTGSRAGRDAGDHVAGRARPRGLPASQPSSPASAPAASGSGSKQMPGPYSAAARQRAAQAPCSPQPMIPTVRASSRASSCAATAATAPGAQRGDRAHVDQRERLAVLGARHADHAHHHRQPARRVAGERA